MEETHSGHAFGVRAAGGRVRVLFEGHEVADSDRALILRLQGLEPTYYFPRDDVQMSVLRRNDHVTSHPLLGEAAWFTIMRDAKVVEDVAWSHERPPETGDAVRDYIAFAPQHVEFRADPPEPMRHVPAHDPPYA